MEKEYQPQLSIDLIRCFQVWKRNLFITVLISLLMFFVAMFMTSGPATDIYQAYSSVYTTAGGGYDLQEAFISNAALEEYSDVITSLKVLNHAADMIGDDQITGESLSGSVGVSSLEDSSVLRITVTNVQPNIAVAAANAVATSFVTEISAITGQNNIHVLDVAEDYYLVQNGNVQQWTMRFLATAIMFVFLSAFWILADIFSTKVHSLGAATIDGELEILGAIPEFKEVENDRLKKR